MSFGFNPTSPVAGGPVTFAANATGGTVPYTFRWSFGDGSAAVSGNPVQHTYTSKGTFTVKVNATDGNGVTASASKSITVVAQTLHADFSFSPTAPTKGSTVTFTAMVTGGTSPYSYSWSFGDGTTGSGNPAMHSYANAGNYTVMLTVTDMNSATASATHIVTVSNVVTTLTADFGPTTTLVGNTTFVAVISGGVSPYSCVWNFGDGSAPQTGCTPVHQYIASGNFTVTLMVTDSSSATATATHTVNVQPAPFINGTNFKHNPTFPTPNTITVHVNNPSSLTITATVTVDVFDGDGTVAQEFTQTITVAGHSGGKAVFTFVPTANTTYEIVASVTYSAVLPVGAGTTMTTTVTGNGGTETGTFRYR